MQSKARRKRDAAAKTSWLQLENGVPHLAPGAATAPHRPNLPDSGSSTEHSADAIAQQLAAPTAPPTIARIVSRDQVRPMSGSRRTLSTAWNTLA